ncbi:DUF614 domain protein [Aspergillus sp. HF37]|nr:DUF614 domain protein [Aspergillus sp. HF37]
MADKQDLAVQQHPPQSPPETTVNGFSATPPIPPPTHGPEWSHSFWDCCSPTETCLVGWCLPCFLFGKTSSRLNDPALKEESAANGDCCIYCLSTYCGLYGIVLMLKRGELRKRFGIEGSGLKDCVGSCFCPCCTLVQHEKEVEAKSRTMQAPYQSPAGMAFSQ